MTVQEKSGAAREEDCTEAEDQTARKAINKQETEFSLREKEKMREEEVRRETEAVDQRNPA